MFVLENTFHLYSGRKYLLWLAIL